MFSSLLTEKAVCDSFFRVALAKRVKAYKSLLAGWTQAKDNSSAFHFISFVTQRPHELLKGNAAFNRYIHIVTDDAAPCGFASFFCLPFGMMFAFSFWVFYDG